MSDFHFHFEDAGLAGYQGPHNPSEEFFTGRDYSEAVARECIQNSLDAKRENVSSVHVEFRLTEIKTSDIPDLTGLQAAMKAAADAAGALQGAKRLHDALAATQKATQWVLSVSDFGTNGLGGTEKIDDQQSPLSILTRGTGASSNDSSRGGSFGIGSAVGPMASDLSTVFYRTQRPGDPSVILAALARLASHKSSDGKWRVGSGHFTDTSITDDFVYARNMPAFPSLPTRNEPGTDVLILGYSGAADDPTLAQIRDAVAANFFAAIDAGNLTVSGHSPSGQWELTTGSLAPTLKETERLRKDVLPFYRALGTDPVETTFPDLGPVRLYIYEDDVMDHALGTLTMRKPLMTIDRFRHQIPAPYAAVLVVPDEPGNSRLRDIEPPEHNRWNSHGRRSDANLVRKLKDFVRVELRKRFANDMTAQTKVKGLERFLPASTQGSGSPGTGATPTLGDTAADPESSSRIGDPVSDYGIQIRDQGYRRLSVRQPAVSGGPEDISKGRDSGGSKPRTRSGGDLDGTGEAGEGTGSIDAGDVDFRSFAPAGSQTSTVVLVPKVNTAGSLTLAPLGAGGQKEEHELHIKRARLQDGDEWRDLNVHGMTIQGLNLLAEMQNRIEVEFNTGRHYRLGVK